MSSSRPPERGVIHRKRRDGSGYDTLYYDDDSQKQEDQLALRRERARRKARRLADQEDRASAGDASLFEPISLADVEEPPPLELGAEGIFPLRSLALLTGEFNTGKTPLSVFAGLARIRAGWRKGERVGFYDSEMGPARMRRLARELGATDDELLRMRYYGANGDRPQDLVLHGRALAARAWEDGCRTLFFDSLISMLSASHIGENDSAVREWFDSGPRAFVAMGGSALVNDHVGHDNKDRGRGSSDKNPAVDFSCVLKCVVPGRRGVSGEYVLACTKDRDARLIGDTLALKHEAWPDGTFTYHPSEWDAAAIAGIKAKVSAPTQDQILDYMREIGRPVSVPEIQHGTGLEEEAIRSAIRRGTTGRNVVFAKVGRGKYENRSGRPVG